MTYYLGVDAGGSHTRARLTAEDGRILGSGESGPANTRMGLDAAVEAINSAWAGAISKAGLKPEEVSKVRAGIGIAGLNRKGVLQGLRERQFPFASLAIASDAAIACLGAHGGEDGGIVIVGTGSVGFARVGEEVVVVGGYGFPISDEGSGADLGLRAVRASLWARDGRIAQTSLTRDVLDHFAGSAGEIVAWMDRAGATEYATFAPLVMDHANRGDAVAEPIVQEGAHRIDRLIRVLLERGAPHCCLMGGLASRLQDWLAAGVRRRLREPQGDALDGAILLAEMRGLPAAPAGHH
ncbi:MAG: N-acetylglucosamine kinase [Kineosporiaceae bacterium]|nr:N-acetylglucosamine kinase [Aeromicrobium sp.]